MQRIRRVRFLILVLMLTASGVVRGGAETPDPAAVTVERIEAIGEVFVESVNARLAEVPAGGDADGEGGERARRELAARECAVPDGAAPLTAVASEVAWQEQGGDPSEWANLEHDAWGRPVEIYFVEVGQPRLVIRSAGANGRLERSSYEAGWIAPGADEDDIVWTFDRFCRMPKPAGCCDEPDNEAELSPDRKTQRRTMTDIRNLGTALLSWLTDQIDVEPSAAEAASGSEGRAPCPPVAPASAGAAAEGAGAAPTSPTHYGVLGPSDAIGTEELEAILRPSETMFYLREIPRLDGWGGPIEVYLHRGNLYAEKVVTIRSAGSDGRFEGDCYEIGPFDPDDADQDVVWADGFFVRWPGASAAL